MPETHDPPITWRIQSGPRQWQGDEIQARLFHSDMPEKFEVWHGKLFWSDTQRRHVLAMLLEELGWEEAVKLADESSSRRPRA